MSQYSEVNFVETDSEEIINRMILKYEELSGKTLAPAAPERLLLAWAADIFISERVNLNQVARLNLPRYAYGDYLDSLAELFNDVSRLSASAATVTMRFHISAALSSAQLVPLGTRVTADGKIYFQTTEAVYISAGYLYADAPAQCQLVGTDGNGYTPGQINQLVDVFPYYESCENMTSSEGGAETESDESFYQRMRASEDSYSTAGSVGSYEYHAKSVSSSISDVRANQPSAGCVAVYVLMKNGQLPDEEMLSSVLAAVSADKVRPLTDSVSALPPETISYDIDLSYYIPSAEAASASLIEEAVYEAIESYKAWQCAKMGRDINPDELVYLIKAAGAKRVELRAPVFSVVNDGRDNLPAQVAQLGEESVINGGYEDE